MRQQVHVGKRRPRGLRVANRCRPQFLLHRRQRLFGIDAVLGLPEAHLAHARRSPVGSHRQQVGTVGAPDRGHRLGDDLVPGAGAFRVQPAQGQEQVVGQVGGIAWHGRERAPTAGISSLVGGYASRPCRLMHFSPFSMPGWPYDGAWVVWTASATFIEEVTITATPHTGHVPCAIGVRLYVIIMPVNFAQFIGFFPDALNKQHVLGASDVYTTNTSMNIECQAPRMIGERKGGS